MVFIVRDAEKLSDPERSRKLIKRDRFQVFKQAEETIDAALRQRDEIVGAAQAAYEAERRRGYAEGVERARLEQSSNMVQIVGQSMAYFSSVEDRVVGLVLDAVRQVIASFDDREHVRTAVHHALHAVRNQKQLSLRVHPAQVAALRAQVDDLLTAFPAIEFVDVVGDAHMAMDACAVESDIGTVEASVSGQIEAMRETFQSVFRASA